MDKTTDSDFLSIVKTELADGAKERKDIMETLVAHEGRLNDIEKLLRAQQEGNDLMRDVMFGNIKRGTTGCIERQRNQDAFLKSVKKVGWLFVGPFAAACVAAAIALLALTFK